MTGFFFSPRNIPKESGVSLQVTSLQATHPDTPGPTTLTTALHGLTDHRLQPGLPSELLPSSHATLNQYRSHPSPFLWTYRDPRVPPPHCTDPSGTGTCTETEARTKGVNTLRATAR